MGTNNESLNIKEIVENSIRLFKNSDEAEVKFNNEINESTLVYADKDQLIRVFNNLIKNAIQSIPEGRKGMVEVWLTKRKKLVTVSVKDNGTGISDEVMDKIFVPNFTTKSTGMGLGLAMVKNIVEGCDGQIWFETEENVGSTFYVSLPEHGY